MSWGRIASHPIGAVTGLVISSVHFGFIYVFAALACARGFAARRVFDIGIVPAVNGAATLVALIAAFAVLLAAIGDGAYLRARTDAEASLLRFLRWLTGGVAALSLVAIAWNGLPLLLIPACE